MTEIYVSTDVEADGPIPGPFSMLSFGSAAYRPDGSLYGTFTANLQQLPGAACDPDTMAWWAKRPDEWNASRVDLQDPETAMKAYLAWLKALPGTPVFVGYPACFDFMFVYWYMIHFVGESPFGHRGLDIRTYAMAVLKTEFYKAGKGRMPKRWFEDLPHTHHALDDALEQGALFCNMLKENNIS
jgi:hypothetical protein